MVDAFLSGMTAALFLTATTFFLKFWKASRNRFFGFFAGACALLAAERIITVTVFLLLNDTVYEGVEPRGWIYLLRLAAFVVIFVAILDRNKTMKDRQKTRHSSATKP